VLRASHPPAGATALLVALGLLQAPGDGLLIAAGAIVIGLAGEVLRWMRLRATISRPLEGVPETRITAPPADEVRPPRRRAA
jgi:hypothetical protein